MTQTSLPEFHAALTERGAVSNPGEGRTVPDSFGDVKEEFHALKTSAGVVYRSDASRIEHNGADALDLLHRLSTNDLLSLELCSARRTVLTSDRGRVIDVFTVVHRGPGRLLLLSGAADPTPLVEWVDRYTIVEDAELKDISNQTVQLAVTGPAAGEVARAVAGDSVAGFNQDEYSSAELAGVTVEVLRTDSPGLPAWEFIVPAEDASAVWDALVTAGARPAGRAAYEALRIERGVPAYGLELTEKINPLEAGLMPLISFTKGCYVGQEVVARLDTYDKVQRRLVSLVSDGPLKPGEPLTADGRDVGWVSSSVQSPASSEHMGLGFVRKGFFDAGMNLKAESGTVTVVEFPVDD
ncbi:MAG: glycine cleavage T C-terminal barrel domain-containing protein [Dehalococcoidia bacterium]